MLGTLLCFLVIIGFRKRGKREKRFWWRRHTAFAPAYFLFFDSCREGHCLVVFVFCSFHQTVNPAAANYRKEAWKKSPQLRVNRENVACFSEHYHSLDTGDHAYGAILGPGSLQSVKASWTAAFCPPGIHPQNVKLCSAIASWTFCFLSTEHTSPKHEAM